MFYSFVYQLLRARLLNHETKIKFIGTVHVSTSVSTVHRPVKKSLGKSEM